MEEPIMVLAIAHPGHLQLLLRLPALHIPPKCDKLAAARTMALFSLDNPASREQAETTNKKQTND
jgi:hypothetical protein